MIPFHIRMNRAGFSLMEVIIALYIFSLAAVAIYSGLSIGLQRLKMEDKDIDIEFMKKYNNQLLAEKLNNSSIIFKRYMSDKICMEKKSSTTGRYEVCSILYKGIDFNIIELNILGKEVLAGL